MEEASLKKIKEPFSLVLFILLMAVIALLIFEYGVFAILCYFLGGKAHDVVILSIGVFVVILSLSVAAWAIRNFMKGESEKSFNIALIAIVAPFAIYFAHMFINKLFKLG